MPAEADLPRYEAFLVQPDTAAQWVVALVGDATRTKVRRFARLEDATHAARLADALNSRLLSRPNHQTRLRAALGGLPLTVHAAARHIPAGDPDSTDLLADHLPGDPIDGLMLFPTTSDRPPTITPRTAYAIAVAAEDIGDLCHEAVPVTDPQAARRFLPRLPVLIRRQRPEQLLRIADDLDQFAASLRSGVLPDVRTAPNRLAAQLAVDHADRLHAEDPEFAAEGSRLLPATSHDYDFATLRRHLFMDVSRRQIGSHAT